VQNAKAANGIDGVQMKKAIPITTLFPDSGGGLPSNSGDRHARKRAATKD